MTDSVDLVQSDRIMDAMIRHPVTPLQRGVLPTTTQLESAAKKLGITWTIKRDGPGTTRHYEFSDTSGLIARHDPNSTKGTS